MNQTLGTQFKTIFNRAFHSNKKRIGQVMGETIRSEMFKNVDNGRDFTGAKFRGYADRTKRDRKRGGFQVGKVDFQRSKRRIKDALIRYRAKATEIYWAQQAMREGKSVGEVFYYHQHGMGNNPPRHIFPDTPSEIRDSVHKKVHKEVRSILNEPIY